MRAWSFQLYSNMEVVVSNTGKYMVCCQHYSQVKVENRAEVTPPAYIWFILTSVVVKNEAGNKSRHVQVKKFLQLDFSWNNRNIISPCVSICISKCIPKCISPCISSCISSRNSLCDSTCISPCISPFPEPDSCTWALMALAHAVPALWP